MNGLFSIKLSKKHEIIDFSFNFKQMEMVEFKHHLIVNDFWID